MTEGFSTEEFNVETMSFELPQTTELDPAPEGVAEGPVSGVAVPEPVAQLGFNEPDVLWLSKLVANGPTIFFDKLPRIEDDLINDVNSEFYKYCVRKQINPWDYLFDELPLLAALAPIAIIHWKNYQEMYGKKKKDALMTEEKNFDYDHQKEVDEAAEAKKLEERVEKNLESEE